MQTAAKKRKPAFKRTITKELFEQWKNLKRTGDHMELVRITGKSAPTIIRALTYGHCKKQKLIDAINNFFESRLKAEKDKALHLSEINN